MDRHRKLSVKTHPENITGESIREGLSFFNMFLLFFDITLDGMDEGWMRVDDDHGGLLDENEGDTKAIRRRYAPDLQANPCVWGGYGGAYGYPTDCTLSHIHEQGRSGGLQNR
jgi:hypothetical protein